MSVNIALINTQLDLIFMHPGLTLKEVEFMCEVIASFELNLPSNENG